MPSKFTPLSLITGLLPPLLMLSAAKAELQPADELSLFELNIPEVTAASRLPQLLTDAPASMTVITRSTIEASGARTLPDLLRLVPGMQVFMTGSNRQGATYHGATNQHPSRLEVMIDGRSVYIPLLSTVVWETLPLSIDDIERVEVVRGSNAATHGSNAFLGAINFITRNPLLDHRAELRLTAGSRNAREGRASVSGDNHLGSYRLAVSQAENDGGKRFHDSLSRQSAHLAMQLAPTLIDSIELALGYDEGDIVSGRLRQPNAYTVTRRHHADFQSLKWQREISDSARLHLMLYRNRLKLNEAPPQGPDAVIHQMPLINLSRLRLGLAPTQFSDQQIAEALARANPDGRLLGEHGDTTLSDAELRLDLTPHARYRHSLALGLRNEQASSPMLFQSGQVRREKIRFFNHAEWLLSPHFTLNAGLLHEHAASDLDATSYRAALLWKPQPTSTLRLGYSHSERLPSLLERERNYVIFTPFSEQQEILLINSTRSPSLHREQIQSRELGVYHLISDNSYLDLRLFHESISNGIHPWRRPNDGALMYANHAELRNRGGEVQYSTQLRPDLRLLLNYSYTDSRHNRWDLGQGVQFNPAGPLSPRHAASALLHWKASAAWDVSLLQTHLSRIYWGDNAQHVITPAHQRTDLQVTHNRMISPDTRLEVSLLVQNLSGKRYQEFYPYNEFDRRVWLSTRLMFR